MKPNLTIIPAHPGTRILLADADARDFCEVPVIAWSITPPRDGHAASVQPVTLAGDAVELDAHAWAVQHPHGAVEIPSCCGYQSAAAWLADLREQAYV
ncbi:hypothetical protein [uncultured Sphaerotilus sp.]|uniref:hypothetical protein n=1 Tax=uncultured Sphaerotilus sp. TaxID=474984 RepID=UPI0030CA2DF3